MPTIITHAAVPLALGLGLGRGLVSSRLLCAGVLVSMLPDCDVLAFRLGIAYAHQFGHRGASHSLLFAAILGMIAILCARQLKATPWVAGVFVWVAAASHGLLDMLTTGGLGVAYLWPFSDQRLFFPVQIVKVSPLRLGRIFGPAGLAVAASELRWIWLPACGALLSLWLVRAHKER